MEIFSKNAKNIITKMTHYIKRWLCYILLDRGVRSYGWVLERVGDKPNGISTPRESEWKCEGDVVFVFRYSLKWAQDPIEK